MFEALKKKDIWVNLRSLEFRSLILYADCYRNVLEKLKFMLMLFSFRFVIEHQKL